jgi:hypothetical protein
MPSPLQIIVHTPLWVWPLLVLTVWLGWSGCGRLSFHRASLVGAVQSTSAVLGLGGRLPAALPAGHFLGYRRDARHL